MFYVIWAGIVALALALSFLGVAEVDKAEEACRQAGGVLVSGRAGQTCIDAKAVINLKDKQ